MKKYIVLLLALFAFPLVVNAAEINTSFDEETCVLTVSGTQTGHEATVSLFNSDSGLIGFKTNTIKDGKFSVGFVLIFDQDEVISATLSNEAGTNNKEKTNINIPVCNLNEGLVQELFDEGGNSIKINDKNSGFAESDILNVQVIDEDGFNSLIDMMETENDKKQLQDIFDNIINGLGENKVFITTINPNVVDRNGEDVDFVDYNKGFTFKMSLTKRQYDGLVGLHFATLDSTTGAVGDEVEFEYDEDEEILTIKLNSLTPIVAYIDNDYAFLNNTENQTYTIGEDNELMLEVDAPLIAFTNVYVDGEVVDSKNYKKTEGSTIITFNKEYMDSLKLGVHTVKVGFNDGKAETKFNVEEKTDNPKTSDNLTNYLNILVLGSMGFGLGLLLTKKTKKSN